MQKRSLFFLVFAGLVSCILAAEAPTSPSPVVVVLQQDLLPRFDTAEFHRGFQELLSALPPDRSVSIYTFDGPSIRLLITARAGNIVWPVPGFSFTSPSSGDVCPYRSLLALIKEKEFQNQRVLWITDGYSDHFHNDNISEFQPLLDLTAECRSRKIKITGIFTAGNPPRENIPVFDRSNTGPSRKTFWLSKSFDCSRTATEKSGGKFYYGFSSYRSLFRRLVQKGEL